LLRNGLIPEAGFRAPKSGYPCVSDSKAKLADHWKINKSKEIFNGRSPIGNGYQAA
jgi:hypothetical protein